jgi:hypothetical protein
MPSPRQPRAETREEWLQLTEAARREARYRFAEQRVRKISTGDPALSAEQRANLARIILSPAADAP